MKRMAAAVVLALLFSFSAQSQKKEVVPVTPSLLKSGPDGWERLMTKDLKGWKRVPLPVGGKLAERNPWKVDKETLVCEPRDAHEMLLWEKELADGTLHVEFRFPKRNDRKGYTSGVYIRTSVDGSVWHQAQVGDANMGYFFGDTLVNNMPKRFRSEMQGTHRGYGPGEWNAMEVTAKGGTLTLWLNGHTTSVWKDCPAAKGYIALEAEGCPIEFRNIQWK